jgi:hypothetical protein
MAVIILVGVDGFGIPRASWPRSRAITSRMARIE